MDDDKKYLRRRRTVALVSLAALILFMVLGAVFIGKPLVAFLDDPESFRSWAEDGIWGRPALVGIMVLQVIISLIPGGVVELAAGYCYGGIEGAVICLIGAAIGSAIVFILVRKFGVELAEAFVSREKIASLSFINDSRRLNLLVFILYLIPGTPKDVFNYFIGLTPMNLKTFLIICVVARTPAILATTVCGDALINGEFLKAALVFGVTALCSIGGMLLYRFVMTKKRKAPTSGPSEGKSSDSKN